MKAFHLIDNNLCNDQYIDVLKHKNLIVNCSVNLAPVFITYLFVLHNNN